MKKQAFLAILMAIAVFAGAQTARIFPVVSDSVHALSMSAKVGISGATGSYVDYVIYKKQGDTAYSQTSQVTTSAAALWRTIPSLLPNQTDTFANVIVKNGVRDTSSFETFTTKALLPPSLTSITVDTSVSPARIRFDFAITSGFSADVTGWLDGFSDQISPLVLSGTGDTSISLAGYSIPSANYTDNYLEAELIGSVSGITIDSFFDFSEIRIPTLTHPSIAPITVSQFQDSLVYAVSSISIGNAGPLSLVITHYDSLTNSTITSTQTFRQDTTNVSFHFRYLHVNDAYTLTLTGTDQGGIATQSLATHTLGIDPATLSRTVDTTNLATTSVTISVTGNSNGTFQGSPAVISAAYQDASGAAQSKSSNSFTGTLDSLFSLSNLKPGPNVNTIHISISNSGLGKTDSFDYQITLLTPPPPRVAPAPTGGTAGMVNASTLQWQGLQQNVDAGDTVGVGFVVENQTSGSVDTFFTSGGYVSNTAVPTMQFTGQLGGSTYLITPFSISADHVYTFGTSQQAYTNAPSNPIVEDIIVDTSGSRVKITLRANGQGTPSKLYLDIVLGSSTVHSYAAITMGTGYVSYDYYPSQYLDPSTLYYASATVKDMNDDNPMQKGQDFMTPADLSTGIASVIANAITVYPNPTADFIHGNLPDAGQCTVDVYDISGKKVIEAAAENSFTIDMRELPIGTYYVRILDGTLKLASENTIVKD